MFLSSSCFCATSANTDILSCLVGMTTFLASPGYAPLLIIPSVLITRRFLFWSPLCSPTSRSIMASENTSATRTQLNSSLALNTCTWENCSSFSLCLQAKHLFASRYYASQRQNGTSGSFGLLLLQSISPFGPSLSCCLLTARLLRNYGTLHFLAHAGITIL